jgi:pyridoxal phosphate enzyme (YggS family)
MSDELPISEKRSAILERMAEAAKRAGRDDMQVLVAVSKVQPDDRIAEMLVAGQKVFGENRVQEAQKRWGETFSSHRGDIELRLIGPLQSNKAEDAVALFDVIETLDREKLAKALVKAAEKIGRMPRLLVQVNTGEEPQKAGIAPKDVSQFLAMLKETYNITPEGLMCIPPAGEAASPHFWLLKKLADEHGLITVSMGMSGDFETAIEMGATHVRVGSALFGERDYN